MSDNMCPKCQRGRLYRNERKGFLEQVVYPFFNRYPWTCRSCKTRMLLKVRGTRRKKSSDDNPVASDGTHAA
jgi:hypothetical protein